jgi:ABC-type lipoprotein export system ATPase subunit
MNTLTVKDIHPGFLSNTVSATGSLDIWHNEVTFRRGERYLITASSGRGKSSFLSYLFGERDDYTGDIRFDDREIAELNAIEWQIVRTQNLSCVFQGLRLFPELTVMENIRLKNRLTGYKEYKTGKEIKSLIEKAGLSDKINERTGRLSFGQQQRVAVIRALCQPFDFLLLDEPFSHLDDENIAVVADIINDEVNRQKAGMLLCSLGQEYPFQYNVKFKM